MGSNVSRYQAGPRVVRPATYWRRRFVALVAGFGVLAVVAWAFSGALAVGRSTPSPAAVKGHGGQHGGSGAPAGGHSPAAGVSSPAAQPSASASPSPSPSRTHHPHHHVAAGHQACPASAVVLSLVTTQSRYRPGQLPTFDLQVVSTAHRCTFNVGRQHLELRIVSGDARVWSSADCAAGAASKVIKLAKGVPAVVPISWHRQTSSAAGRCGSRHHVPNGRYDAIATDGKLRSGRLTFRIG
jgi:hypothetical protein